jgi:outer membrane protein assembly factor BamB
MQVNRAPRALVATLVSLLVAPTLAAAQHWGQWRGPDGLGISAETGIATRWTADHNIAWRVPLEGLGTSTPVIWGDRIFLTSQLGTGPVDERGAQFPGTRRATTRTQLDGVTLLVQAYRREDGRLDWEHRLTAEGRLPAVHRNHNPPTPSVVTDGDRLFAWFGTGQLVALDLEGHELWARHIGEDYAPFEVLWGHGSSPQLYEDLVILQCDHPAGAYLLALDTATGEERWMVDRGPLLRAYSTPLVVSTDDGDQLIVNSSRWIDAYDPSTGRTRWRAGSTVELATGMPVYDDGVIYSTRGYSSGPYLSVETDGRGDVSETHVRWRHPTRAPYVSSMLLYRRLLYMATENGILTITDPDTGTPVARTRLNGVYTASPIAANGHVYLLNEDGETVVLEAGPEARIVSRNPLDERALASPAIAHGRVYIRTDQHLWAIGPR